MSGAAGVPSELVAATRRWIDADPDPATRAELRRLLADASHPDAAHRAAAPADTTPGTTPDAAPATHRAAALAELSDRMAGPLSFGTAGLRGPVRAGPNGMNVAVVRRATAGLAAWLRRQGPAGGVVVVGRDARHGSAAFAPAAAGVLAAAGFDVRVLPGPLPTPVLAYAVRALGAVAGVQITASHNPARDNGYKVYLGGPAHAGAQLVAPADAEIEAEIAAAPAASDIPVRGRDLDRYADRDLPVADVLGGYLARVARLPRGGARRLRVALTPLHGVGGAVAVRALRSAGFHDVHLVPGQAEPDPDFPTVPVPNPEEPGATDALLAMATDVGADLAVALDPDADRCAVGVPVPGGWRMLTGDELGALLGEHLLATGRYPDPLVASTVVSSGLLAGIAAAHGARHAETLTGFKWIARAGPGLVYGYEEAIGYCVDPDAVRDKDGIAAAVLAADLAATRAAAGDSLLGALDELALRHGVHLTGAVSLRMGAPQIAAALERVARAGGPVERPAPDVLVRRGPGTRVAVRPSGTEPKLKAYLEVVEPVAGPRSLPAARERAADRLAELSAEVRALLGG